MTSFGEGSDFTIGVEEEFQLVDPETGDLVSRMDAVYEAADSADGELQSELFRSMIETATPVCEDVDELGEEMARLRGTLADHGRDQGLAIAASGTHPFAKWEEQEITPDDRYEQLIREIRLPIKRELVFGQHVHVAVGSAEEAVAVTNKIRAFLPLVLALSTNAPFWRGVDSGLQSARVRVFDAMLRSGTPRTFEDWDDLVGAIRLYKEAGSIEDMTKVWWDVRPRPQLGTVEIRIADLPTELEDSLAVAALTYALVVHLAKARRAEEPVEVTLHPEAIRENRWRALRDGLEAEFIELDGEEQVHTRPVAAFFDEVLASIEPTVDELGLKDPMARLKDRVARGETGADRQRRIHDSEGSLRSVVRDIVERTPPRWRSPGFDAVPPDLPRE